MAQGVAEAERERELSKQALAARASALGSRVRDQLDWRAKLQRDGLRYMVIGGAAVVIAGGVILIRSRRNRKQTPAATAASLDDIATQLAEIRKRLDGRHGDPGPLWQRLAIRAVSAAAAGAGGIVARRMWERFEGAAEAAAEKDGGPGAGSGVSTGRP